MWITLKQLPSAPCELALLCHRCSAAPPATITHSRLSYDCGQHLPATPGASPHAPTPLASVQGLFVCLHLSSASYLLSYISLTILSPLLFLLHAMSSSSPVYMASSFLSSSLPLYLTSLSLSYLLLSLSCLPLYFSLLLISCHILASHHVSYVALCLLPLIFASPSTSRDPVAIT